MCLFCESRKTLVGSGISVLRPNKTKQAIHTTVPVVIVHYEQTRVYYLNNARGFGQKITKKNLKLEKARLIYQTN